MHEGDRLKAIRKEWAMTQQIMAQFLEIPQSTYTKYEQGGLRVSDKARTILFKKRVDLTWLLTGEGEMFLPSEEEKVVVARPSLDSLVATKEELAETEARLATENVALKQQLDEQGKRIAALEDLAKSYLPDIASRSYGGGNGVAPSSPLAAKGAKR